MENEGKKNTRTISQSFTGVDTCPSTGAHGFETIKNVFTNGDGANAGNAGNAGSTGNTGNTGNGYIQKNNQTALYKEKLIDIKNNKKSTLFTINDPPIQEEPVVSYNYIFLISYLLYIFSDKFSIKFSPFLVNLFIF